MSVIKNGYYIHFDAKISPGVSKKIDMQIEEFRKYFIIQEINVLSEEVSLLRRLCRLLPGGAIDRRYQSAINQMMNPDFVYVRRATADRRYIDFFKTIKKKWPNCKIIIEIFTYPYDKDDYFRLMAWPYYFKEKFHRKKLVKYVDRFVTYSQDKNIFGVTTICTGNGIQVDKVKVPSVKDSDIEEVNIIAVAYMQKHHGYERLIRGLEEYYKYGGEKKVVCHFIGDGPEKKRYQRLVKRYKLEDKVIFYSTVTGDALDELYEKGDIAVSSLGFYKDGIDRENTLKNREYMAKGFPMIVGCKVDGLTSDYPFVCQFPNDSSAINIKKVISFYEKLLQKYSRKEMQCEIRKYGKKIADMSVVMQPIIDFIES